MSMSGSVSVRKYLSELYGSSVTLQIKKKSFFKSLLLGFYSCGKTITLTFTLTLTLFSTSVFAEKPLIPIQHWDLNNKTHVFFVRRTELPMLDVELVFDAGSAQDGHENGLSFVTNAMIGEGAKNISSDQIAKNFENVGAQFFVFANRDMAGMTLRTLIDPKYLNAALENFSTVISMPTFPERELDRVKQQIIAAIKSQAQNPKTLAANQFYQSLYQDNFYAHNPLGNNASIVSLKQAQLIDFYKRYYVGANANLVLVGDITETQAKKIAKEIAGNFPSGNDAPQLSPADDLKKSLSVTVNYPASQSTVLIGQVGITRNNPDYFSLMVGNAIFGGLPMSSILYSEVREKRGFSYAVDSGFDPLKYRGPFMIELQTKLSTASEANALVTQLLKHFIENGPTEAQLEGAKKNLLGSFPLSLSSNDSILKAVTNIAFYHRPLNYFDTYQANVSAVTQDEVKKAFQKNIDVNKLVTVVVGQAH